MKTNIDEVIERISKALQEMEGKEVADIANQILGTNLIYLEDGNFDEKV